MTWILEWILKVSSTATTRRTHSPELGKSPSECGINIVQFSHSVMSNSLRPHGLQHTRLPCPSPTPGACSNLSPSSQWYHPTISSSVILFSSSCLQSFPASGSFPRSQFFASGGQSIRVSASASVLPMNIQDWFPWQLDGAVCPRARTCWTKNHGTEVGMALISLSVIYVGTFCFLPMQPNCDWSQCPILVKKGLLLQPKDTVRVSLNPKLETFLVVQWLKIHLLIQGTQIQTLVQEDSTCHGATKTMDEFLLHNKRSHHSKRPTHCNERVAPTCLN